MVLVFTPYHEQKRYCLDELLDWVRDADLPAEVIIRFHRGPYGEHDAVKNQREFARTLAIEKNATHLFFVGVDTIPPLDALPRLLAHNLDVVGGLYYGRQDPEHPSPVAWGMKGEGLTEVDGMGMDCVLFSRKAFESTSFLDWVQKDDDYPMYELLRQKGFKIYLDTTLVCKHYYEKGKYV